MTMKTNHSDNTIRKKQDNQPATNTVALNLAQLCLDCSQIYDQRAGACPICGSKASLGLLRVVDRKVTR